MGETVRDVLLVISALGAFLAAAGSLWNAYQFAVLSGRMQAVGRTVDSHVNAPGLHAGR